jgi:hypothetical protein
MCAPVPLSSRLLFSAEITSDTQNVPLKANPGNQGHPNKPSSMIVASCKE